MSDKILITGGAGFIGSNFIRHLINNTDASIVNLDALTYAGNLENLSDIEESVRYRFVKGRIEDRKIVDEIFEEFKPSGVINFAAESHVDRSILDSSPFISTNIQGTVILLEAAKKFGIDKFVQISTDEVYGSLGKDGKFTENTNLKPNSPYSASKTAADNFVRAYYKTHGTPAVITRCSNNYGPYQFPEKLIPLMILNALEDKELPVYGDGMNVRDWIYVVDHCEAIWTVYKKGEAGEVYNIGAENEMPNLHIIKKILEYLNKPESLIKFVKDRPGHDRRYAMDNTKISSELGWKPKYNFDTAIEDTIEWYLNNLDWCKRVRSGKYLEYYEENYGNR